MKGRTVSTGTVPGPRGSSGLHVLAHAGWVNSSASGPFSLRASTGPGVRTSWEETWKTASVIFEPVKVKTK